MLYFFTFLYVYTAETEVNPIKAIKPIVDLAPVSGRLVFVVTLL